MAQREAPPGKDEQVQGEGNYEAGQRFNEEEQRFVKEKGTPRQPPLSADEERDIEQAEEDSRARGIEREHDPQDEAVMRERIERGSRSSH
jgi:hypothetical protein